MPWLLLGIAGWFIWKPLAGFFLVSALRGTMCQIIIIANYHAPLLFWDRRAARIVGILFGILIAIVVRYGSLLWGGGVITTIGISVWGLLQVINMATYTMESYRSRSTKDEMEFFGAIAYAVLLVGLFFVPV